MVSCRVESRYHHITNMDVRISEIPNDLLIVTSYPLLLSMTLSGSTCSVCSYKLVVCTDACLV